VGRALLEAEDADDAVDVDGKKGSSRVYQR
jgi:hypothetical protein